MKVCTDCRLEKSLSEFSIVKRKNNITHYGSTHYKSICKPCSVKRVANYRLTHPRNSRREHIKGRFNLDWDEYLAMISDAVCEICGHEMGVPCIDHDKDTGLIRGILCKQCNMAIGLLMHDSGVMRNAANYIDAFKSRGKFETSP